MTDTELAVIPKDVMEKSNWYYIHNPAKGMHIVCVCVGESNMLVSFFTQQIIRPWQFSDYFYKIRTKQDLKNLLEFESKWWGNN